jgi:hypothetical protein
MTYWNVSAWKIACLFLCIVRFRTKTTEFMFFYSYVLIVQDDSKLLSGFPWPIIFKPRKNKMKLLTEYEIVTQNVSLSIESMCGMLNNFYVRIFRST